MASSPLILAALAKSILPSAKFKQARSIPSEGRGPVNSALLTDSDGIQYVVREARNAKGNLELATETQAVRAVKNAGSLPFNVPALVAESTGPNGNTLQVLEFVYGSNVEFDVIRPTSPLVNSLGKAIAAIHSLSIDAVRQAGMPEYSAAEIREARLAELDRAASSGRIPATLLQRWESALEDLDLFRFQPTVVHGNLVGANVLELGDDVSGVLGWSSLEIGDPAQDFIGFAAQTDPELFDAVRFAYQSLRTELDQNLAQRATLYSELAIAAYLVSSISSNNEGEAQWAESQLESIASLVEEGSALPLGRVAFASALPAFVDEVDLVVETDSHVLITEAVDESVDVSDLRTRPIELPTKSDDQLF
jgi:aminoglycoside phosphotransferase (APT) family kinase protein